MYQKMVRRPPQGLSGRFFDMGDGWHRERARGPCVEAARPLPACLGGLFAYGLAHLSPENPKLVRRFEVSSGV